MRKNMFSAASELAYLSGWMASTNAEHSIAQRYFSIAVKLAAEADDPPMAGHVLRAMAHQAVDLGHFHQGLDLAAASMDGKRYLLASPRERALFGVIYARALGATGQKSAAVKALIRAEDDLASATTGDDEPPRVFFFGAASLAHQTACTLRDTADLSGALKEFHRSVRTRKATTFTRTHALTLGHLGAVQARHGQLDQACSTWSTALDAMDGIRSGRTRQAVVDMHRAVALPPPRYPGDRRTRRTRLRLPELRTVIHPADVDHAAAMTNHPGATQPAITMGEGELHGRLGVSRCRLIKVDDLDLHVKELDAVHGIPVLDIKAWFHEFGPRGTVRQAAWSSEMLAEYFATPPHDSFRNP
ncbi:MAG: hypothetical protein ACRDTA_06710 [Pseudonocardiaceae bacterium]